MDGLGCIKMAKQNCLENGFKHDHVEAIAQGFSKL
jgi:hypothetical protein